VAQTDHQELILVLDENLHRFPWETIPCLSRSSVCRVPSLPFALAPVVLDGSEKLFMDPTISTYILDPESNLPSSRKTLSPKFASFCKRDGWDWSGLTGRLPDSPDYLRDAMVRGRMIVYCGHGGAENCFPRTEIDRLISDGSEGNDRLCKSTVVLMGCSSGRIGSDDLRPFYEPDGVATDYLCSGSPCVVANLWDVTDRDIDRFFIAFLDGTLGSHDARGTCSKPNSSLAEYVSQARGACKLRYLVGSAPVCYGVPIRPRSNLLLP